MRTSRLLEVVEALRDTIYPEAEAQLNASVRTPLNEQLEDMPSCVGHIHGTHIRYRHPGSRDFNPKL